MKKILFIGKFNVVYQDISHYLERYFHMQMCIDNYDMAKGMLKVNQPDLVMISLVSIGVDADRIFSELRLNYGNIPVVCVGSRGELDCFASDMKGEQFQSLLRPVKNEAILEKLCELLKVIFDGENIIDGNIADVKKRILLVDDNTMQLRTMNDILKEKYDVQMANSGMKALTMIGKKRPDLIFLDYEMPMCDGKMTMEMIREVEEAKDIPIVFLTGVKDKEHIEAVLRLRPAGYLLKPAGADVIYSTIEKILGE